MAPNNFDNSPDAIPMKKMGPVGIVIGVAVVLIIGGLVAFGAFGHKKKPVVTEAQLEAAEASAQHQKEQAKEIRNHLAITRRAMAAFKQEQAAASASAQAQAQQAPAQQAPEQHHVAAAHYHHAVSHAAAKKQMHALDNLSKSITSQLGN